MGCKFNSCRGHHYFGLSQQALTATCLSKQVCHIIIKNRAVPVWVPVWIFSSLPKTGNSPRSWIVVANRCGVYGCAAAPTTHALRLRIQTGANGNGAWPLDASSLSEAREALARLRAEPPEHNRRKKRVPLFPEFWPTYIEAVRHQKRERTIKSEQVFLRQWEAWLGPIPINRISTAQVIGFRTERLSRGLSGRTANLAVTVLNNLLNHARDLELIQSLLTEGMKPIRWKHKKRPLFTVDDINRLCTAAIGAGRNGQMLSDYLRLMACCGSRRDETLRLRWSDVDWQRRQLWVGADGLAKNHEARVVDFNSALRAHLEAMHSRREQNSVYLFPAPRRGTDDRQARNLKESLRKIRDQAGCPGFGFHDCRHHFISYAVMSGIDYLTIARWVGHKDGGVLIGRVYGHLTDIHTPGSRPSWLKFKV